MVSKKDKIYFCLCASAFAVCVVIAYAGVSDRLAAVMLTVGMFFAILASRF